MFRIELHAGDVNDLDENTLRSLIAAKVVAARDAMIEYHRNEIHRLMMSSEDKS